MAVINQKKWAEVPSDWFEEFRNARIKPSPFEVIDLKSNMILGWTKYLEKFYVKKCPFSTRPLKEVLFDRELLLDLKKKTDYNGHWYKVAVAKMVNPEDISLPKIKYNGKKHIINFY